MELSCPPESRKITVPTRDVPVMVETDVLVCGGGPAGANAAIAAARMGAKVTMLERYNHLGGLATGGLVIVLPALSDDGRPIVGGIGRELHEDMVASGESAFRPNSLVSYFEPEALKYQYIRKCIDVGVEILHHCWISDAIVENGRVGGVIFESKAHTAAAMAKVVVDATGDGDIYAWAGAEFEKSDQTIGLDFRLGGVDSEKWQKARENAPDDCAAVMSDLHEQCDWGGPFQLSTILTPGRLIWGNNGLKVADALDPAVLSEIELEARVKIRQAVAILRKRMPGFEGAWLVDTASQLGVRRSRRLKGMYQLSEEDTSQYDFRHPDAIGRGNDFRREGFAYDIPYGALVPEKLDGVLTCGRCLSCDDAALEPMREIHVCWVGGEAAGTAAAMAADVGVQPRDVNVGKLQDALRTRGVAFAD